MTATARPIWSCRRCYSGVATLAETERAVGKTLRDLARGTGFKVFQRALIWQDGDMVAELRLHGLDQMRYSAKPVAWDDILWDILNMRDQVGRSITRHWKQFATPVPTLDARPVPSADLSAIAAALLNHAQALEKIGFANAPRIFPELFAARAFDEKAWHFVLTEVVCLIAQGRDDDARALCEAVIAGRRDSRFTIRVPDMELAGSDGPAPHRSFFELALRWLDRKGDAAPHASDSGG